MTLGALTAAATATVIAADRISALGHTRRAATNRRGLGVGLQADVAEVVAAITGDLTGDRARAPAGVQLTALADARAFAHAHPLGGAEAPVGTGAAAPTAAIVPAHLALAARLTLGALSIVARLPDRAEATEGAAAIIATALPFACWAAGRAARRRLVRADLAEIRTAGPADVTLRIAVAERPHSPASIDAGRGIHTLPPKVTIGRVITAPAGASTSVFAAGFGLAIRETPLTGEALRTVHSLWTGAAAAAAAIITARFIVAAGRAHAIGDSDPDAAPFAARVLFRAGIEVVAGGAIARRRFNADALDAGSDRADREHQNPGTLLVICAALLSIIDVLIERISVLLGSNGILVECIRGVSGQDGVLVERIIDVLLGHIRSVALRDV